MVGRYTRMSLDGSENPIEGEIRHLVDKLDSIIEEVDEAEDAASKAAARYAEKVNSASRDASTIYQKIDELRDQQVQGMSYLDRAGWIASKPAQVAPQEVQAELLECRDDSPRSNEEALIAKGLFQAGNTVIGARRNRPSSHYGTRNANDLREYNQAHLRYIGHPNVTKPNRPSDRLESGRAQIERMQRQSDAPIPPEIALPIRKSAEGSRADKKGTDHKDPNVKKGEKHENISRDEASAASNGVREQMARKREKRRQKASRRALRNATFVDLTPAHQAGGKATAQKSNPGAIANDESDRPVNDETDGPVGGFTFNNLPIRNARDAV